MTEAAITLDFEPHGPRHADRSASPTDEEEEDSSGTGVHLLSPQDYSDPEYVGDYDDSETWTDVGKHEAGPSESSSRPGTSNQHRIAPEPRRADIRLRHSARRTTGHGHGPHQSRARRQQQPSLPESVDYPEDPAYGLPDPALRPRRLYYPYQPGSGGQAHPYAPSYSSGYGPYQQSPVMPAGQQLVPFATPPVPYGYQPYQQQSGNAQSYYTHGHPGLHPGVPPAGHPGSPPMAPPVPASAYQGSDLMFNGPGFFSYPPQPYPPHVGPSPVYHPYPPPGFPPQSAAPTPPQVPVSDKDSEQLAELKRIMAEKDTELQKIKAEKDTELLKIKAEKDTELMKIMAEKDTDAYTELKKMMIDEKAEREAREAKAKADEEARVAKAASDKKIADDIAAARVEASQAATAAAKSEAEQKAAELAAEEAVRAKAAADALAAETAAKDAAEAAAAAAKTAKEEAEAATAAAEAAAAAAAAPPPAEKRKPIKFKDAVGRKFSFPFDLCNTWEGMEDLIRQAFLHVDIIGPHVAEGHYDLIGPNGDIILPRVWKTVIEPDWTITMHMWPMPEPPKEEEPPVVEVPEAPPVAAEPKKKGKSKGKKAEAPPPPPPAPPAPPPAPLPPGVEVIDVRPGGKKKPVKKYGSWFGSSKPRPKGKVTKEQ